MKDGKDIADYNPVIDYEGLKPKDEPDVQEQREDDPDAAYVKMEMPRNRTLHQRLGLSPKAAKLFIREQGLDSQKGFESLLIRMSMTSAMS